MHGNGKKHEPVYCWNSEKTYNILSVKKVLIQVIVCFYMVVSFAPFTTQQGKISVQDSWNGFRTRTIGLSQWFFSITPVFSAEGFPFLFVASLGHQNNLLCFTEPPLCTSLQLTKSVYYKCKSRSPEECQAPFSAQWNKMVDRSQVTCISAVPFSFLTSKLLSGKAKQFYACKNLAVYFTFHWNMLKAPFCLNVFSEDLLVQRTSKVDDLLVHWSKPLVWGKWTLFVAPWSTPPGTGARKHSHRQLK